MVGKARRETCRCLRIQPCPLPGSRTITLRATCTGARTRWSAVTARCSSILARLVDKAEPGLRSAETGLRVKSHARWLGSAFGADLGANGIEGTAADRQIRKGCVVGI